VASTEELLAAKAPLVLVLALVLAAQKTVLSLSQLQDG